MIRAAIVWVGAALLAACSPAQDATQTTGAFGAWRNAGGRSWVLPDARSENLLYIADAGSGGVLVYSYLPALKFVGVLSEPPTPGGERVDAAQDLFVTDVSPLSHVTYEYAHGGESPIGVFADPGGSPSACSIDPTTGDLAVASVRSSGTTHGKLAIYKRARGTAKVYGDAAFRDMMFCGYDAAGDLFVDGIGSGSAFQMAELPKGGKTLAEVTLDHALYDYPSGGKPTRTVTGVSTPTGAVVSLAEK